MRRQGAEAGHREAGKFHSYATKRLKHGCKGMKSGLVMAGREICCIIWEIDVCFRIGRWDLCKKIVALRQMVRYLGGKMDRYEA